MVTGFVSNYIAKKLLDSAIDAARKVLIESDSNLISTRNKLERSIGHHLKSVHNWSKDIRFKDLTKPKATTKVFVELGIYVYPRRLRLRTTEIIKTIPLKTIFEYSSSHIILLGHVGAGKTTSMMYLCQTLFAESTLAAGLSFPLVIKLRDLNSTATGDFPIRDRIYDILGLSIELPDKLLKLEMLSDEQKREARAQREQIKEKLVISVLEELKVLLILDGFDELAPTEIRERALKDIRILATSLDECRLILTSRTGEFAYSLDNATEFEIAPLNQQQIERFAHKWLRNKSKVSDFLRRVNESPFADTAIKPLTLAHLCAIYDRTGEIPEKPRSIYKKIVELLLVEWDEQRSLKRHSRYAGFGADRKIEFLSRLAYELTRSGKAVFDQADLLRVYNIIHEDYGLASRESKLVVDELESHTGLFLRSGAEHFEFVHKSIQEYLAAEYLCRLPSIPSGVAILSMFPNELAIATCLSFNASAYLAELVIKRFMHIELNIEIFLPRQLSADFYRTFISRLMLEKPDFNKTANLGLALVTLYTLYLRKIVGTSDPINPEVFDRPFHDLEALIDKVLPNTPFIETVSLNYELQASIPMADGNHLCRMKREESRRSVLPVPEAELPEVVYVRQSVLDSTKNELARLRDQ